MALLPTRELNATASQQGAAWSAVFALSLCVFVLIASEFLPVSLLTPIAADLAITEGEAGRGILCPPMQRQAVV